MDNKKVIGIIVDENGSLEDLIQKSPSDFVYRTELSENVVFSFNQDFETVASSNDLFNPMLSTLTEKLLPMGIPVKGFVFTKNKVVVITEVESTAYIMDWPEPGMETAEKILFTTAAHDDDEYDDGDDDDNDDNEYPGGDAKKTDGNAGTAEQ